MRRDFRDEVTESGVNNVFLICHFDLGFKLQPRADRLRISGAKSVEHSQVSWLLLLSGVVPRVDIDCIPEVSWTFLQQSNGKRESSKGN
jgi:hypothetical protein